MEDYQPLSKIGHGSYGEVWLSRHKTDKKKYVLKQINIQNASRRERTAANLEAKLLATLKHPNIVSYRDSFIAQDGFLYIAMGFCEGGDLYSRIRDRSGVPFEEPRLAEWFIQICMALQYLHERNILHRDLKTQNIFLTKSGLVKVGDLGIAKVLGSATDMATTLIGTPYYMSPELFSNKPYNYKSDVWALGCCVYEMATLKHAFNARDINALVSKILRGKLPVMPRNYSDGLVDVIRSLLHHDPDKRPTVSRVLRHPYIRRNITAFLGGTESKHGSGRGSDPVKVEVTRLSSKTKECDGFRLDVQGIQLSFPSSSEDDRKVSEDLVPTSSSSSPILLRDSKDLVVNGFEMKLEERRPSLIRSSDNSPRAKPVLKNPVIGNVADESSRDNGTLLPRLPAAVRCNGGIDAKMVFVKEFHSPCPRDWEGPRPGSCLSNHARDRRRRRLVRDILEKNPMKVEMPRPLPQLPVLPVIATSSMDREEPERPLSAQSVSSVRQHTEGQLNLCARQRRRERLRINQPIPAVILGILQN